MKVQKKYEDLINNIVDFVGGKSNISSVRHCTTRLRFNLKDKNLANVEQVEGLNGVVGTQWNGGQLQVIIGTDVKLIYPVLCEKYGLDMEKSIVENLDEDIEPEKKFSARNILSKMIEAITGSVTPCLMILSGSGTLRVIILLCTQFGWLSAENPTIVTLTWIADAAFYFLPVYVAAFAAKKFEANIGLGMLMGAMLIHPTFVSMVAEGSGGSIFGLPIRAVSYSTTIVPAILSVWAMSKVEKFCNKYIPSILNTVITAALIILVMAPLTLCVLAPLGSILGEGLTAILVWAYNHFGFLAIGIMTGLTPLIVMTGMHFSLFAVYLSNLATLGFDVFVGPPFLLSNIAQGAACMAVAVKTKNKERKALGFSTSFQNIVAGISEPGMYGITLKYKTPMIAAIIGGFAGGAVSGLLGVKIYAFLTPNIFCIPGYLGHDSMALVWLLVTLAVTFIVTFVACLILYKDEEVK